MGTPKSTAAVDAFPELTQWMRDTGANQTDLANLIQVSQSQMSRYLSVAIELPLEKAVKISLVTGVPVDKLLKGREASRLLKLLGKRENTTSGGSDDSDRVV